MKLHLPKGLRAALIAAFGIIGFTLPQSYAEIAWSGGPQDSFGYTRVFYMNNNANATLTDTDDNRFLITSNVNGANPATGEITSVVTKDGALMRISGGNNWGSDRILNPLTIDNVQAGDGSGTVNISTEQWNASRAASDTTVSILAVSGTVGSVENYGVLTLGSSGGTITASGAFNNHDGATLTIDGSYVFDVSDTSKYTLKSEGSVEWSDSANSQGFKKTTGSTYYAIKGATEGANIGNITSSSGTDIIRESSGNYYFEGGAAADFDYTKFYVKADTATLEHDGEGQIVVEKEGATLTVRNATYRDTSGSKNLNIVVGEGGVLEVTHSGGSGYVTGGITIQGGGTFRVAGQHDAFGWGDTTTKSIILQGSDDSHIATLDLQQTTGNSATMNAALKLMGNAAITGAKGFNTHDGSYYAEGVNNSIESFQIRHAATFEVKEGGELTVGTMTKGQDGNKTLTKTGMGTMTFTTKAQAEALVINEGAIVISGSEENSFNAITIGASGTLKLTDSASLTMSGNLTSAGAIVKDGDGTLVFSGAQNVLSHVITLQGGVLTLSGAYDVSELAGGGGGDGYIGGEISGNGFLSHGELVAHVVDITDGASLNADGTFTANGAVGSFDTATGNATFGSGTSYNVYYVNVSGSAEGLAHAIEAAGAQGEQIGEVRLANGTALNLNSADAVLPLLAVAADANAALNVTENSTITRVTGAAEGRALTVNGTAGATLTIGAATTDSFAGAGSLVIAEGATVLMQGNNTNFTGDLVINGMVVVGPGNKTDKGTNSLGSDTIAETAARSITINSTGVLDLNGLPDTKYAYVLAGGKLTNSGQDIGSTLAQTSGLKLTADSTVEAGIGHEFWLLSGGYAANKADLQGYTLVKTGDGRFGFRSSTITAGTLEARNGEFHFNSSNTVANMLLTGGTFTGAVDVKDNITVTTRATADMSAALNIAEAGKVLTFSVDADQTHTQSGAVSGTGAIAKSGAGTLTLSAANTVTSVTLTQGIIKATAAGALGSGTTTVAAGTTLEMTVGNAVSGTGSVSNAGNVLIHNTLTAGTIAGGVLTLADDFAVTGDLEDVGGLTDTGNGFSQGGVLQVYDTSTANLTNITSIVHGSDTYQLTDLVDGAISKGGANWTIYQLNQKNDNQPTIRQIMEYAESKDATLASIAVNGNMLWLVDDTTTFKASMLSGTDEHLQMFSLMLDDGAELGMDADLACGVYLSTDTESHATINLEKDVTVGMGLGAYNEGSTSNLTIDGAHTLSTPYFGVESGTATLQGGAHLVVTEADGFGIYIGDTLTVKGASEISIPNTGIKSVDGAKDAVLTNDSSEYAYDIADPGYTLADAELTVGFADAHELGNVLSGAVAVVNAGAGILTDVNTANLAYDGLHAQNGNIVLQGRGENVTVHNLTVDAGRGVSMTDTTAGIVVSGTATFGNGSTVGSALTMAAGSTLDGTTALASHALSIERGVNIGDTLWSTLNALPAEGSANIFTGVSALTLAGAKYSGKVDLSDIFNYASLKPNKFSLSYDGSNVIVTKNLENNRYWKGGNGPWNTTDAIWTDEDGGGSNVTFESTFNAHFTATTGGTVTLGENIIADSVSVTGADYTFAAGGYTLTVNNNFVVEGHTATLGFGLNGAGLRLAAKDGGALVLNGSSSVRAVEIATGSSMTVNSGNMAVQTLSNEGTLTVTAGDLTITNATAKGGNVTAANLTLASGESTFASVKVSGTVSGANSIKVGGASNIGTLSGVSRLTLTDGTLNLGAATGLTETSLSGALTTGEASLGTVAMAAGSSISGDKAVSASSISVSGGTANILGSTKLQTTAVSGSGTLKVNSGSSVGIASGATMAVSGTLDMQAGSTLGNQGTLNVSGKVIAGNGINLGRVNATGTVEVNGAEVFAAGGSIATLDIGAGETLAVANDLALTSTAGTAGSLTVDGGLTVGGTASLTNVTTGTLELTTAGTLTASGTLDAGSITLDRVSKTGAYLTAETLSDTTTAFVVDKQLIWDLNASTGQIITLAYVDSAYAGAADLSINGVKSISDKNRHTYTIMQDASSHDIILKVEDQESGFVWTGNEDTLWSHAGNWSNLNVPGEEDWAQVKGNTYTIELDDEATVAYFTVSAQSATLNGDHTLEVGSALEVNMNSSLTVGDGEGATKIEAPTATINGTLVVQRGSTVLADATTITGGTLNVNGGTYTAENIVMEEGAALHASADSHVSTSQLNCYDDTSLLSGKVIVEGQGGYYSGRYAGAEVVLHEDAVQTLVAGEGLTVEGDGTALLAYSGDETHMDGFEGIGLTVVLSGPNEDGSTPTLVLDKASGLIFGSSIHADISAIGSALTLDTDEAPDLLEADSLYLDGSTVVLHQAASDGTALAMATAEGAQKKGIYLAHLGGVDSTTDVQLDGNLLEKYYENARLEGGRVLVDRRTDFYADRTRVHAPNAQAGAGLLDDALVYSNPQVTNPEGDLSNLMTALELDYVPQRRVEKVMAAVSGASHAALGAAWSHDVDRQLRAIRNRTAQMGLSGDASCQGLPYFNAWINAEGDYHKLNADGLMPGYKMSSWGATLGFDVDCTPRFTFGAAFSALSGDFTAYSEDRAEGDLDRMYVSVFGRYTHRAWTHTLVFTYGSADTKIDRTVDYVAGGYNGTTDSDGSAWGLMYELGYVAALNEDASTCLQPIVNVSYRQSTLNGAKETSASDAALEFGDAEAKLFSAAVGARLQSVIGTNIYNRASLFEGRVLFKFDSGDRAVEARNAFVGVPGGRTVKSAEVGVFGVEVGAGVTIPMAENAGALFLDVTGDFRSKYTEINGTVGYRFNF
ncbi:MAG: hypothetical protein Q3986_02300 [Akkermansia sp.]|nr:hypothetical protein [Akkermansia sp.]